MGGLHRKLLRESGIYSLQPFLAKAISVFLIPLYTAHLTTEQFGRFAFIFTLGAFIAPFINLGQTTTFWKYYTEADGDEKKRVVFRTAGIKFLSGIVLTLLVIVPACLIRNTGILLVAHVFGLTVFSLFKSVQNWLRANHRPGLYVASAIGFSLLLLAGNIVYVVFMGLDSAGVVLGMVTANILFGLSGLAILFRISKPDLQSDRIRQMIRYGLPLAFGNLAGFFLGFSDKIMLKAIAGDSALGLYAFSFKFGQLFQAFVITPFFLGWNPMRWEVEKRSDGKAIFSGLASAFDILMPSLALAASGVLMLAGAFLSRSDQYLEGLRIIPLVTLGFAFFGMYYFDSMGILFSGRTRRITLITGVTAALNIVLNFILIRHLGFAGAAVATASSYFLMRWMTLFVSQKLYPITRRPVLLVVPSLIASAGCSLAALMFRRELIVPISLLLLAAGIVSGTVLLLANRSFLARLRSVISEMKGRGSGSGDIEIED
jgi:O-antigen/teichoic acid export membrane protein